MSSELSMLIMPTAGKMVPDDRETVLEYLNLKEGVKQILNLKDWKPTRSVPQNNTVRGKWMPLIMKEEYGIPYTKEEEQRIYDSIKFEMEWTVDKVNKKTGEVRKFPRDTHTLDTTEYSHWMEMFARHVSMNHRINLPPPDRSKRKHPLTHK